MGLPLGIILAAVGAILAWAVEVDAEGVNLNTIGYILLIAGGVAIVISVFLWSTWAGPGYFSRSRRTVVDRGPAPGREVVDVEDEYRR